MSVINMNIMCFIIILVSTSLFSVATAIDGYIFESDAEFFHKLLLANGTTKTNEFSFTFCRDPACKPGTRSSLKISFGSAKSGSSLISFKLDVMDVSGQGVATVTSVDDLSIATTAIPSNTLPSEEPTQQPIETTNTVFPEKSTSTFENVSISSIVIYVFVGATTFVMVTLVSAVTSYFVVSKFSNFKPPENDTTKFDAEETTTNVTTLQYNIHTYFTDIKTKLHKEKTVISNKGTNNTNNYKSAKAATSNKTSIGDIRADGGVQVNVQCEKPKNHQSNFKKSINTVQQQPKRKPKMSSSGKKEKEELLLESHAIQLLSQIYDMTQSLLNDTREVIKKFDQDEGISKNSTEAYASTLRDLGLSVKATNPEYSAFLEKQAEIYDDLGYLQRRLQNPRDAGLLLQQDLCRREYQRQKEIIKLELSQVSAIQNEHAKILSQFASAWKEYTADAQKLIDQLDSTPSKTAAASKNTDPE